MNVFKTAPKGILNLGYFCKNIFHQELSKIAQSGHTERYLLFKNQLEGLKSLLIAKLLL